MAVTLWESDPLVHVTYRLTLRYRPFPPRSVSAPVVAVRISAGHGALDTLALLDSGAEFSLFDGVHADALGLRLQDGQPMSFWGLAGGQVLAYIHDVKLEIENYRFHCPVAFSESHLGRNVIGRNFFDLVQVGFREHQGEIYLDPSP